jgi:hypothetical protein
MAFLGVWKSATSDVSGRAQSVSSSLWLQAKQAYAWFLPPAGCHGLPCALLPLRLVPAQPPLAKAKHSQALWPPAHQPASALRISVKSPTHLNPRGCCRGQLRTHLSAECPPRVIQKHPRRLLPAPAPAPPLRAPLLLLLPPRGLPGLPAARPTAPPPPAAAPP